MILPLKPLPPTDINPRILLLYGPPKIGKTSLIPLLKDYLIMDCENGTKYIESTNIQTRSLVEITQVQTEIYKAKKPYKFVVYDPLDKIQEWIEVKATEDYRASVIGKNFLGTNVLHLPDGGGYLWLREAFHRFFTESVQVAPYIIFICHLRDQSANKTLGSATVISKDLDLVGKIRNIVCAKADAIGAIYRDLKGTLKVSFKTAEAVNCGSRCKHLKGQDFEFNWKKIYIDKTEELVS